MRNRFVLATSLVLAACGSSNSNPNPSVTCGAGTSLQGDTCVPDSTGSGDVTCGTGTHLDGTMCVPDGSGTPGAPTISGITPTEAGAAGFVLFQITGTNLAGQDPTKVHVYFGDTTPSTMDNPNPCEAEVGAADDTTLAGEVPPMCGDFSTVVTVVTDQGMASTGFHYDALFAAEGEGGNGELYLIDPFSQLSADFGPVNDGANNFKIDALAFDGTGALWATTTGDNTGETAPQLGTISLSFGGQTFGTISPVGPLTDGTDNYVVTDMKFNNGTLYGWGYDLTSGTESLVSIGATGTVTVLGTPTTTTFGFAGLGFDGTTMYVTPSGASSDDTDGATGELDTVTAAGAVTNAFTLAYDPAEAVAGQGAPIDALEYIPPYQLLVAVVDNGIYGNFEENGEVGATLAYIDQTSGAIETAFELPSATAQSSTVSAIAWVPTNATLANHARGLHWNKLAPGTSAVHH